MLGERFGTVQGDDNSIMRYVEEIRKEMEQSSKADQGETEKQQQELKEKNMVLSMRLKLVGLDQQLLNQSIMKISTWVLVEYIRIVKWPHQYFVFILCHNETVTGEGDSDGSKHHWMFASPAFSVPQIFLKFVTKLGVLMYQT